MLPRLDCVELDGHVAVVLSPYDISCALDKRSSFERKGHIPVDAAVLGANVLMFGLQRKLGRFR
jgi:hypothetical protein